MMLHARRPPNHSLTSDVRRPASLWEAGHFCVLLLPAYLRGKRAFLVSAHSCAARWLAGRENGSLAARQVADIIGVFLLSSDWIVKKDTKNWQKHQRYQWLAGRDHSYYLTILLFFIYIPLRAPAQARRRVRARLYKLYFWGCCFKNAGY